MGLVSAEKKEAGAVIGRANTKYDGGEAILEAFRALGVGYVFSSPGSEWTPLWEAFARQEVNKTNGPKYINCTHESLAVSMAVGYTRATSRMQAVVLHTGAGLLQGSLAIRSAFMDEVPLLVLIGDVTSYGEEPRFDLGVWWLADLSVTGGGPIRYAEPFTKWSKAIGSPSTLYRSIVRAGEISLRVPRGPCVLSIPLEVMGREWKNAYYSKRASSPLPNPPRIKPDPELIERVVSLLLESKNPFIVTESAGRFPSAFETLTQLSEHLAIPVVEINPSYYANFPKDNPLHAGSDVEGILNESDLCLVIAAKAPWYPPTKEIPDIPVIIIDEDPVKVQLPYQALSASMYLEGDVSSTLSAILNLAKNKTAGSSGVVHLEIKGERREKWEAYHKKLEEERSRELLGVGNAKQISGRLLCRALADVLPKDTIYVEETIVHRKPIMEHLRWNLPNSYFHFIGGGLGLGLGSALGVKLAFPKRPVACLIGDGSFLYNPAIPSLMASADYNLPILVVIFNNSGYSSMRMELLKRYPEGISAHSKIYYGSHINNPDYSKVAELFGGYGRRVEDAAELKQALSEAERTVSERGKLAVVDVVMDAQETR